MDIFSTSLEIISENGVIYFSNTQNNFENEYIALRKKEKWYYEGNELLNLPYVGNDDQHYQLWKIRASSAQKIISYLIEKNQAQTILDLGCGNGWLTNKIAKDVKNVQIAGLDLNYEELLLAAAVFKGENIFWVYGDIFGDLFRKDIFDVILLSASVQYFPDFDKLILQLFKHLKSNGEIHILDSPFYKDKEIGKAKKRTKLYYQQIGFPGMENNYFHRRQTELKKYSFNVKYSPNLLNKIASKIANNSSLPFPWIILSK